MSSNLKQVELRIETLAEHLNFSEDMFTALCKDIAAEIKRFGGDERLKSKLKEVIHKYYSSK